MVEQAAFEGWAILELMGHRRMGGYVSEATISGVAFIRIDVPKDDAGEGFTQFYSGGSVYCLTPCSEDAARGVARANRPEPVHSYELPKLPAAQRTSDDPRDDYTADEDDPSDDDDTADDAEF